MPSGLSRGCLTSDSKLTCYLCQNVSIRNSNIRRHGAVMHKLNAKQLAAYRKQCMKTTLAERRGKKNIDFSLVGECPPPLSGAGDRDPDSDWDDGDDGSGVPRVEQRSESDATRGPGPGTAAAAATGGGDGGSGSGVPRVEQRSEATRGPAFTDDGDCFARLRDLSDKMGTVLNHFGALFNEFELMKHQLGTHDVTNQLSALDQSIKGLTGKLNSMTETQSKKQTHPDSHRITGQSTADPDDDSSTDGGGTTADVADTFPWLIMDKSGTPARAKCSTCCKFGGRAGAKNELWVSKGVVLGRHAKQRLIKHARSNRHRRAAELETATKNVPSIETATQDMIKKSEKVTGQNLTIAYHGVLRSHSYEDHAQEHLLLNTLGFDLGNQHQTGAAAAQAVDTIYETFTDEVARHLATPNPATGRRRHIHLSLDKFTEGRNQRQAVNLRVLDSDGCPVVVHGTTGVIRTYNDPVPEYTAQQMTRTTDTHQADGRGVTCHTANCLRDELHLTDENIGVQVTSSSTDCEAVYAGKLNGFRRIWQEKFNQGLIHLDDRDHRLETLLAKATKEDDAAWMEPYLDDLRQVIGLFLGSPLLRRHVHAAAAQLEEVAKSLQRLIETRFIEYLVTAVKKVLHNRAAMMNVLHDMIGRGNPPNGAHQALRTLESADFMMNSLLVIDVMTPAVSLSKAGQSATYSVFQDQREVRNYKASLENIAAGTFAGLLDNEGPGVAAGSFRGAAVGVSERYALRRDGGREGASRDQDELKNATKRRQELANTILRLTPTYLDMTPEETLITETFNMEKITNDTTGDYGEKQFSSLVTRITAGPLTIPASPCSGLCDGAACECVLRQYRVMKERIKASHSDFPDWMPFRPDSHVRSWRPENVLKSFQDVKTGLHKDIPDAVEIAEICLVMSRSQSDTERVGKTAKRVSEGRFEGKFDERKDDRKDRAKKEVFIIENAVPLKYFPAAAITARWLRHHRPSVKRAATDRQSLTVQRLNKMPKKLKFMFE